MIENRLGHFMMENWSYFHQSYTAVRVQWYSVCLAAPSDSPATMQVDEMQKGGHILRIKQLPLYFLHHFKKT